METIRVLQVLDKISYNSGACSVVLNYFNQMKDYNIIFDFMVHEKTPDSIRKEIESKGSKIYEMPSLSISHFLGYINRLNVFFKDHTEYKIIHGHIPNAAVFYLKAAKKAGVKTRIIHSHSSRGSEKIIKNFRNFILTRLGVIYANEYFACSKEAAKYMFGSKSEYACIVRNAIDVNKFKFDLNKRNIFREKMNVQDNVLLGHVGRFSSEKNQVFLVQILSELKKRGNKYKLLLIGDGPLKDKLQEYSIKMNVSDLIIYTGVIENVNDYLNAIDVFLLPSLFEGLPVVGIEAQCNGLMCVFSDNISQEVKLIENVNYCSIDNIDSWIKCIENYNNDDRKELWKIVECNGFSIINESQKLCSIYRKFIEKNN